MNVPGLRACCTGLLATNGQLPRVSRPFCVSIGRRRLHASSRLLSTGNGDGSGDKPADGSTAERSENIDDVFEPLASTDAPVGRTRSHAVSSLRSRQARRRIASALPPVKIPQSFLDDNVSWHDPEGRPPRLPLALQEDAELTKTTRAFRPSQIPRQDESDLYKILITASTTLQLRLAELTADFTTWRGSKTDAQYDWSRPEPFERVVRLYDMIINTAKSTIDLLYPSQPTTVTYRKRPWWWWDAHKNLDHDTHMFRIDQKPLTENMLLSIKHGERFDDPLSDSIMDLPPSTFDALRSAVGRELRSPSPPNFDTRTSKRQINILALQGYGGKAISNSVADQIAYLNEAVLVRLDAYDLSMLVGDYLGQNWAYSRGALSMLGFRAADLSGRSVTESETFPPPQYSRPGEDENDDEGEVVPGPNSIRPALNSLEGELQKIKQGAYDCFNKWELLKIDKILDQIIRSGFPAAASSTSSTRPVLIHLDDFVELSMTMEGTVLINRLRALVDAAWQQGAEIAILATSASEEPSEDYRNALRELSVGDLTVIRRITGHGILPDRRLPQPDEELKHVSNRVQWNLLAADYAVENISNVNRMLRALDPETTLPLLSTSEFGQHKAFDLLRGPILPATEVYHLASTYRALEKHEAGSGKASFTADLQGQLVKRPAQTLVPEDGHTIDHRSSMDASIHTGDVFQEQRYGKLNEYERRIASGQVKRENLRTTFADVHVPTETISALKILTSLALVRPDAFSYGVLAADRIPGCLLYGPPGTGKTMLAKAVAKESGANMLEISGATINDKWVGESEKLIRAVFTMAKRLSPCVVFIDEADSILANRTMYNRASHRELINQFLKEWDGMEETNAFIMVATNRPFDLDDAVLRRLPRKLLIDIPTKADRAAILRLMLRGENVAADVSLDDFAQRTPLYSGSDLKNVCVAAAMAAVEEENDAAARHTGDAAYEFPERRTLRRDHFERGLKQIPASISEDMVSLKMIRKFDEEYGRGRKGGRKTMGFGVLDADNGEAARVRQIEP